MDGKKTELIRYSYEQVLDATKHQDDKIGRLLTTIAFLTASSLAIAGLGGKNAIEADFILGASSKQQATVLVPVAFVFLMAFLVAVILAVIQLVGSLSTPLRLPGLDRARTGGDAPETPSTLYFHEIEKSTPADWKLTWDRNAGELAKERRDSLIRETHNLALRTSYKYNRTGEATAVLTWALIALTLTVTFSAIALADKHEVVLIGRLDALAIGFVVATVTLVWSVARMRHALLAREYEQDQLRTRRAVQLVVATGAAAVLFWGLGLPVALSNRWAWLYEGGLGFLAVFVAAFIELGTLEQPRPTCEVGD